MRKAENLIKKWGNHQFSSGVYTGDDYEQFQRSARIALREEAEHAGYKLERFLGNHYCFSAVLYNKELDAYAYVSCSDVRFWPGEWVNHMLYRQMKHAEDWTGGANHYCGFSELGHSLTMLYR